MVNLWQELERLDQIRTEILANLSVLNTEISSFESLCEGQDDELLEHISPIQKALAEMIALTTKVLPQKDQELDAVLQEKLEDIVSFQRKFVHDLRNPLGVVLGYSELLEEILDDYDDFDGSLLILKNKLRNVGETLQKFNQHLNLLFPNPNHHHAPNLQSKTPIPSFVSSSVYAHHELHNGQTLDTSKEFFKNSKTHDDQVQSQNLTKNQTNEPLFQEAVGVNHTPSDFIQISKKKQPILHKDAKILVVDDNDTNRKLLCSMLDREGYTFWEANSGEEALVMINEKHIDLLLLDFIMQGMSGLDVLTQIKKNHTHKNIAVIMISGDTDLDTVIKSIELGAEDYLSKPFNSFLLKARIGACLEKKRLLDELEEQNLKFEVLLNRILPTTIVKRMSHGESTIADHFSSTSILFSDIVGFTKMSSQLSPSQVISLLNEIFMEFDALAEKHGVEKIKTIGDAYMAATGVPLAREDHADALVQFGLGMIKSMDQLCLKLGLPLKIRVGIHSGPVAGGIIGQSRFLYDIWGDTVNMASRLEASGEPGSVHVSSETLHLLSQPYQCRPVGGLELKGKGFVHTYLISP